MRVLNLLSSLSDVAGGTYIVFGAWCKYELLQELKIVYTFFQ